MKLILKRTRLRFEVFNLERLWTLDKVFVLPTLEIGLSVAVGGGGVILSLREAYILSLSLLLCLEPLKSLWWVVVETYYSVQLKSRHG